MNILIYSINYAPELTGIGKYNSEFVDKLISEGHKVTVVTTYPYYPQWVVHEGFENRFYSKTVKDGLTLYRCPIYVPKKPTVIKRILHLISFALSSSILMLRLLSSKFDVVFTVQPTLFCAPMALLFSKIKKSKSILHIQDFELDAMLDLLIKGDSKFKKVFLNVESFLLNKFDVCSTISNKMIDNLHKKGVSKYKTVLFQNWADIKFVNPSIDSTEYKLKLGYDVTDKVILYAGNLGAKQGLEIIIDAALRFSNRIDIKFLIVGSGSSESMLRDLIQEKKLDNIRILPLQPWEDIPYLLNMASIHLVVQRKGVADLVLPSKLTNILSAGGYAVVTAEASTELSEIEKRYNGIYSVCEPENPQLFYNALSSLLVKLEAEGRFNAMARTYAEENLDKNAVIDKFLEKII